MSNYEGTEDWADVDPIAQNEGGPNPLAAIAYTEEYSEAMSYLRAVMAKNEMSQRVLDLTEHIIGMNPAHYTVWLYRAQTLKALNHNPIQELEWLNQISLKHLKNYQIWHHRQVIMSQLSTMPSNEGTFLARMLSKDAKNYHVWSYRQWLVRHFKLWSTNSASSEIAYVESLLGADVRNNSAWNHRWFVIFGNESAPPIIDEVWEREIEFAKGKIWEAPQNQSAWNYLRGVLRKKGTATEGLKSFATEFADLEKVDEVRSSHALDFLAEIWAKEKEKEKAERALALLAERYDPIRKNYWEYRKGLLQKEEVTAEA